MRQLTWSTTFKHFLCAGFLALVSAITWAQDTTSSSVTTTTTTKETTWYASPWVWVAGAALFILILVAIMKGGSKTSSGSSDRVTVTKTVRRDTDANP